MEQIRARYGISTVNFVKPGVGETTRVLLRRVPWMVLVREADATEHATSGCSRPRAEFRSKRSPDLAYSCMGLIKDLP